MSSQLDPIFFKGISMVTAVPDCALGTERIESGEKYVYVYNCGGSTATTRLGLSRPASAVAGIYSCSVSSVSGQACLGFVKHVSIPPGEYGWALKRGLLNVDTGADASHAANTGKALGANGVIATVTAGYSVVGETISAIASGASASLFVNLP